MSRKIAIDLKSIEDNKNEIFLYFTPDLINENDKKLINKINCITYKGRCEVEPSDFYVGGQTEEFVIKFEDDDNEHFKESFLNFIVDIIKSSSDINPLIRIINFFKVKNNSNLMVEEIKGAIGEALFILKCIQLGVGQIAMDKYNLNDRSLYDFSFDNNTIEIKNSSIRSKQIKLNHSQMPNSNDQNIYICIVNTKTVNKSLCNHKNIIDLYDEIEKHVKLSNNIKIFKEQFQGLDEDVLNKNAIDINDYSFKLVSYDQINPLKITTLPNGVKDLIYVLDTSNYRDCSDEQLVNLIK